MRRAEYEQPLDWGPQGPQRYFGVLRWGKDNDGRIALCGPFSINGKMNYGEVYHFLPPQPNAVEVATIDFEWLVQQMDKHIVVTMSVAEGPSPMKCADFLVLQDDGLWEHKSFLEPLYSAPDKRSDEE